MKTVTVNLDNLTTLEMKAYMILKEAEKRLMTQTGMKDVPLPPKIEIRTGVNQEWDVPPSFNQPPYQNLGKQHPQKPQASLPPAPDFPGDLTAPTFKQPKEKKKKRFFVFDKK